MPVQNQAEEPQTVSQLPRVSSSTYLIAVVRCHVPGVSVAGTDGRPRPTQDRGRGGPHGELVQHHHAGAAARPPAVALRQNLR